jgi:pyruvate kinase
LVDPVVEATVDAACVTAERLDAPLIVVATDSGRTALALSNRRPTARILALTRTEQAARILALCWGVTARVSATTESTEQKLDFAIDWAKTRGLVQPGQHVVLLRGEMPGQVKSRAVVVREVF